MVSQCRATRSNRKSVERQQRNVLGSNKYRSAERQWSDPAVAVLAGAAVGLRQHVVHRLGGNQRGVQADRPGRGGAPLGGTEEQAQHELRQAEPGAALLLRQEHHDQGARQEVRLQVRLPRPGAGVPALHHRAGPLQVPGQLLPHPFLRDLQTQPGGPRRGPIGVLLLARVPPRGPLPQPQPAGRRALRHRVALTHQLRQQHQQPGQHQQPLQLTGWFFPHTHTGGRISQQEGGK